MPPKTIQPRCHVLALAILAFILAAARPGCAADFRITSIRVTNNDVRVNWNAPGGSNYVLQSVTPLSSNFVNMGPTNFVQSGADQSLSFTNVGAKTSAMSRFYRVRSFPPPLLQIQPTNVVLGTGMTNRYKVLLFDSDGRMLDVTTNAALTFASLNASVATLARVTNGFAFVRGVAAGTGSLRATFQGLSNTVNLTVSPLTGLSTVPPLSQINGYVGGSNTPVTVMGTFANGQTVNITPSCNVESLSGGSPVATRADYNVRPDVANSFALITGQSAAVANDVVFHASGSGQRTSQFGVNWYWFSGIALVPNNGRINVGATQQFTVVGYMANGVATNALSVSGGSPIFTSSNSNVAQVLSGLRVKGISTGRVTLHLTLFNGPGVDRIATCTTLEVGTPTNAASNMDNTFNCCGGTSGSSGYPQVIATQPDGRVLIGGAFFAVNGIPSVGIQRLLPNGNVDAMFRSDVIANDRLRRILVQPDGKLLFAAAFLPFTFPNGGSTQAVLRLQPDGRFDTGFIPAIPNPFYQVSAMVLQPDGKILIGGDFTGINGISRIRLARLHPDGILDETFHPGTGANAEVHAIALDSQGRIYIGGSFTNVNGIPRARIARLTSSGTLDPDFEISTGANAGVSAIVVRETGPFPVLIGGSFTTFRGLSSLRLAALDTNGLLAPGLFAPPGSPNTVNALALQPDGKTVVVGGGAFTPILWRLTTSNTLDSTFAVPGGVLGQAVLDVSIGTNATIDITGVFDVVGGLTRRNVARLLQSAP